MFAALRNESVTAELISYVIHPVSGRGVELVWAEFAPAYPKIIAAVWASLVAHSSKPLTLTDADTSKTWMVQPLKQAYRRYEVDCPDLSSAREGRPKFIRLVHPHVGKIEQGEAFYILDRYQHSPGQLLAAALEYNTHCPVLVGWGEYLLAAAQAMRPAYCQKLETGTARPVEGYWFSGEIEWQNVVAAGIKNGYLSLDGDCVIPAEVPIEQEVTI